MFFKKITNLVLLTKELLRYINTIFLLSFLFVVSLCFSSCNSIDKKNILPNKKPLSVIINAFPAKTIFNKKVTDFKQDDLPNSGILFTVGMNRLFVVDASNKVKCLDLNGIILWEKGFKNSITAGPVFFENKVLIATAFPKLFCLDALTGEQIWETPISSELLSAPSASSGVVYIRTLDGSLVAISLKDGKQLWGFSAVCPNISLRKSASPVVSENKVVAGFSNGKLLALDKNQGSVFWSYQLSNPNGRIDLQRITDITADPIVLNGDVYAVGYQGNLVSINLHTGESLWEKEISSYLGLTIKGTVLFVATKEGNLLALNRKTGAIIWEQNSLIGRNLSKPIIFDNYLVMGDQEGNLHFLDTATGNIKGRIVLNASGIFLPPLIINKNQLYVLHNNGYLTSIEIF